MTNQKALVVTAVGKPLTLVENWPVPQPGPKQLQIRVTVAGLNPHDQKSRDAGLFISDKLPALLASDLTGVVTALGPGTKKFKVGDKIWSQASLTPGHVDKGFQQYAIVDEVFTAGIPEGFTEHDVATIPTNAIAPLVGFFDPTTLALPSPWSGKADSFDYPSKQILIIGGGSNCGRFAVQFARLAGFGKIVVLGGNEEELKKYGATHVLDRHGGDDIVLKRIRDVVGDDLIYAFDAVNPPTGQHLAVNALSNTKKGKLTRLVMTGTGIDESKIVIEKQAGYDLGNTFGVSHARPETATPFWENIEDLLLQKKIVPLSYVIEEGLNPEKANAVLDRYRDGKPVIQTHFRISK